jgi:hypothetical protein
MSNTWRYADRLATVQFVLPSTMRFTPATLKQSQSRWRQMLAAALSLGIKKPAF